MSQGKDDVLANPPEGRAAAERRVAFLNELLELIVASVRRVDRGEASASDELRALEASVRAAIEGAELALEVVF